MAFNLVDSHGCLITNVHKIQFNTATSRHFVRRYHGHLFVSHDCSVFVTTVLSIIIVPPNIDLKECVPTYVRRSYGLANVVRNICSFDNRVAIFAVSINSSVVV